MISLLISRPPALVAAIFLLLVIIAALFAPIIASYDPLEIDAKNRLQKPNLTYLFGTDNFGRDIFSRILYGTRTSLIGAVGVVLFALLFGVLIGIIAAYFRKTEVFIMRIIDSLLAFPPLLMALVLVAILGRGLPNVIVAVGISYLARTTRIVFGLTLKIAQETYVEAIVAEGASPIRIIGHHLLPNLISPMIVQATFIFAFSLLEMAALDFLGLGLPPDVPSWGNMINGGKVYMTVAPWLILFPGSFIVVTSLSLNVLGDLLRDHLDPRFQRNVQGL